MQIVAWIAQAIVFVIWVVMLVNLIGNLRARAQAEGQGLGAAFGDWLRSEDDRRDRRSLGIATLLVIVLFGLSGLSMGAADAL